MKWVALFAVLAFVAIGLTAIDKYDERTCVQQFGTGSRFGSDCNEFLPW